MIGYFATAFAFTLGRELGFSNDQVDRGGRTQDGITQATLDEARQYLPGLPLDVAALTEHDEARIYETMYWDKIDGDLIPDWAALALFDAGVNSGAGTAVQWMQLALSIPIDGIIGTQTRQKIASCDARSTLREFHARRAKNYMDEIARRPAEVEFDLGWGRRLLLVHDRASALIT